MKIRQWENVPMDRLFRISCQVREEKCKWNGKDKEIYHIYSLLQYPPAPKKTRKPEAVSHKHAVGCP